MFAKKIVLSPNALHAREDIMLQAYTQRGRYIIGKIAEQYGYKVLMAVAFAPDYTIPETAFPTLSPDETRSRHPRVLAGKRTNDGQAAFEVGIDEESHMRAEHPVIMCETIKEHGKG